MKKSILKITLLCICIVAVLAAATVGAWAIAKRTWKDSFAEMESSKLSWASHIPGTLLAQLELTENTAFESMTAYDYEFFSRWSLQHGRNGFASSANPFLMGYHSKYPIERIEALDDSHVCVVYKLEDDQKNIVYAYVVFESLIEENDISHRKPASTSSNSAGKVTTAPSTENKPEIIVEETWMYLGEFYYVSASLSYSDFASVKIGDSYEKFAAIDPAVQYDYNDPWNSDIYDDNSAGFVSYRLLKDGLLIVEFEDESPTYTEQNVYQPSAANEHTVKSMEFYPFGAKNAPSIHNPNGIQTIFPRAILSTDSIDLPN